jgi:N-methylhydantoinase B/oxoprolinase/acetone carboxylase alpha subunit
MSRFELARFKNGVCGPAAQRFGAKILALAQTNHDYASRRERATWVQHDDLTDFSAQVAAVHQFANRTIERLVQRLGRARGSGSLKHTDDDGVSVALSNQSVPNVNIHWLNASSYQDLVAAFAGPLHLP